ncbi:DUF1450 domain-containing protein [Pullulanibacillus sp. KACC 23026]|uniref:DUF1450 domain-containing protein n=1 Tax=Pullulanibacillus sp. KACC 23026 TaxID=3028315 RepID=UPI0023B0179F|nr:DUF1450 domain-containing protein [Pullulanibacillus sp. KACC 23026]WEG14959.1 DUF1450 domain-containing protein [Pullulanibacillus sp. KACC 23026]
MGIVVVEICEASLINNLNIEEEIESIYPEVSVITSDCLSFCGICRLKPYAMVNNKRIFANSAEECLIKIKQKIEEELAFFN